MKDTFIKAILVSIPIAITFLYIIISSYMFGESFYNLFFLRHNSIIYTYILLASLTPLATYEYLRYHHIRSLENDIPTFLSALEASLTAGLNFFSAITEAGKHTKTLSTIIDNIVKHVRAGKSFESEVDKLVPSETFLLKMFREYMKVLSKCGEELYETVAEYRHLFGKLLSFKETLYIQAKHTLFLFSMILFTYIVTAIIIAKYFLEAFANRSIDSYLLYVPETLVDIIESAFTYILCIQVIGSGIALSIMSGSRRLHMLLPILAVASIMLTIYALFIYDITSSLLVNIS